MSWWRSALLVSLILCALLVACGGPVPSGVPGGAPAAATGGGSPAASPASDTPVETDMQGVVQVALGYARQVMGARNATVNMVSKGQVVENDPNGTVWVVQLSGDTFHLPPCSVPSSPTYERTCGDGSIARLGIRMRDNQVVEALVSDGPATPYAVLSITLPPNAKLKTREDAIRAALFGLPTPTGDGPRVVSVDLILAGQESTLNGTAPDTPIWRVSLDHGQFDHSCPAGTPRDACVGTSATYYFDAASGSLLAESISRR